MHAASPGVFGELVELFGEPVDVVQGVGLHVGADQDQRRSQLGHQVELALGALQVARQLGRRGSVEITERLKHVDGEPQVLAEAAHLGRRSRELQQVVLEDLHAVEVRRSRGLQLLAQHS